MVVKIGVFTGDLMGWRRRVGREAFVDFATAADWDVSR